MERRWFLRPLVALAWLVALVEFVTWDLLQALGLWCTRRLPLRRFEAWAQCQRPGVAAALLFLPALLLVPFKFLAAWLFLHHHWFGGLLTFFAVKLGSTLLVAWLFALVRPVLLGVARFARFYHRVIDWRARILAPVVESPAWHRLLAWRRWLRRRLFVWRAAGARGSFGRALALWRRRRADQEAT